ncbi:hypothetical protein OZ911_08835 [Pseudomonas fortuita]|uniref:Uncharacterized protein n=1 Tax=Pseudomonas fortuita TaxID=3233375 RepID=A0ACD4PE85_9PSED|nr:hypothetical protein [Pseudomonas putida]WAP65491.1 hypothetical protein OZ911_08835 [Pseudomonas putida]
MRKIAIFVEGQTELHFVSRLITEVAGYGNVAIELWLHRGGAYSKLREEGASPEVADVFVMLVNCCGDGVKTSILERKSLLFAKGFEAILGLQDLYPKPIEDLDRFQAGLDKGLADLGENIKIFLAVGEVEAWFLNEFTHFEKLDSKLSVSYISKESGFNPEEESAETEVRHPAGKLKEIYALADIRYRKREGDTHRLVSYINYENMYLSVRGISKSLDCFLSGLETVLFPSSAE